jgi:hypothetical protein
MVAQNETPGPGEQLATQRAPGLREKSIQKYVKQLILVHLALLAKMT